MPIKEVALELGCSVKVLRILLSHIPNLGYETIRTAGFEILFANNSCDGRSLGFLVDGDPFEVLDADEDEMRRMEKERAALWACLLAHFKKLPR